MPEGMRCRTVCLPPMTRVWPALCPPWKRTTPWAWSVSQSTILPLPSSPHCVPITTTFLLMSPIFNVQRAESGHASSAPASDFDDGPDFTVLHQLPVTVHRILIVLMAGQADHDRLPLCTKLFDFTEQRMIPLCIRCQYSFGVRVGLN